MKWLVLALTACLLTFSYVDVVLAKGGGSHGVRGHVRSGGSYVPSHQRTNPNRTRIDNWSTKGNVNPYTGKQGTQVPR
jgi:hypothetical protein